MIPVLISHYTLTSCLGRGIAATRDALARERSGLTPCDFETADIDTFVGEVRGLDRIVLDADLADYDCRNNRLAQMALEEDGFAIRVREAVGRYGHDRVGVFIGTTTSGILQTEIAYRTRDPVSGALPDWFAYRTTHSAYSVGDFVARRFGATGPSMVVSAACASSAKVFASAARAIGAGLIDAAIVGGVDSLCLTTLYGFKSLELISTRPCRPFDSERDGISIGEAAAFALIERAPEHLDNNSLLLLGVGESSDAYHMSAPHPEGLGARKAIEAALQAAALAPEDIDYINLHGTATRDNDSAEDKATSAVFGNSVPCSSTKGATGHTLGAAGAVEAVISLIAIDSGVIPGGLNTAEVDPGLQSRYLLNNQSAKVDRVLSNSFGFGGVNCSLVFGRAQYSPVERVRPDPIRLY